MQSAGYSGTPLARKLGLKPGMRVCLLNPPEGYLAALGPIVQQLMLLDAPRPGLHAVHAFYRDATDLAAALPALRAAIAPTGMLWLSWPKKAAKLASNIDEGRVRALGLAAGLVDIKVCAVDPVWSALKFVVPVKERG